MNAEFLLPSAPLLTAVLFHVLPSLLVAAGTTHPFLHIFRSAKVSRPLGLLDFVALAITAGGTILETVSDEDLYIYRLASEPEGEVTMRSMIAET